MRSPCERTGRAVGNGTCDGKGRTTSNDGGAIFKSHRPCWRRSGISTDRRCNGEWGTNQTVSGCRNDRGRSSSGNDR